jgi:hypothetical protein
MDEAEVEEGAGDDSPPLSLGNEERVDEVLLADRSYVAAHQSAAQRLPVAEQRIEAEQAYADGDDRVGHERRVRGVGAARPVELPAGRKVVAGLLEQPCDAVGDGAAFGRRRPTVGLAVRADRGLQVPVAHELLRHAAPSQPGAGAVGVGRLLPRGERTRLVVGAIACGSDGQPRIGGQGGVGMAGERREDPRRRVEIAGVEQPATLGEPLRRFVVRHVRRILSQT